MKTVILWIILAILCLTIGTYPLIYLFLDGKFGLLQTKSDALLSSWMWKSLFFTHIFCGGIALSIGWIQFSRTCRIRFTNLHRQLGKLYVLMVSASGTAAVCIAPFSSTGWVAQLGFGCLGVIWLYVTLQAYRSARHRNFHQHECRMIYSFSACMSAVTLRLWLPLLLIVFRLNFQIAYPMVAWLSWIPNLLIAHLIVTRARHRRISLSPANGAEV